MIEIVGSHRRIIPIRGHRCRLCDGQLFNRIFEFSSLLSLSDTRNLSTQWVQRSTTAMHANPIAPPEVPSTSASSLKKLAVFVSGGGSNFRAIHDAIIGGKIRGDVVVVVTNAPSCGGAEYARAHGIPVVTYPPPKEASSEQGEFAGGGGEELAVLLAEKHQVDYIILAGYMKLIPAEVVRAFPRSILNIHPGLLPSFGGRGFYGTRVHKAVIASGARLSGPTIHFIDEEYDTGPILAQAAVPVYPTDSPQALAARVLKEEHRLYPECVAALCDDRVTWREDGVPILWTAR